MEKKHTNSFFPPVYIIRSRVLPKLQAFNTNLTTAGCDGPTWNQWVLYAEHRRRVSICHGLHYFLFGDVRTPVRDADPRFQVVEIAAVELEELDQQHAQVRVGVSGIDAWMKLRRRQREETFSQYF